jgi:hypothetical protein
MLVDCQISQLTMSLRQTRGLEDNSTTGMGGVLSWHAFFQGEQGAFLQAGVVLLHMAGAATMTTMPFALIQESSDVPSDA